MRDEVKFIQRLFDSVQKWLEPTVSGLEGRLDAVEEAVKAVPEKGPKGDKGEPGESVVGPKGDPGKDHDPTALDELRAAVQRIEKAITPVEPGIDKEFSARVSKALGEQVLVTAK